MNMNLTGIIFVNAIVSMLLLFRIIFVYIHIPHCCDFVSSSIVIVYILLLGPSYEYYV